MTAELVCPSTDRQAWLEARRSGVTATDIVRLLHGSPWELYQEKTGALPEWEGNARTRLGTFLESYAMGLWAAETGMSTLAAGLYRSAERPWQLATPDWLTPDEDPLELKTWADADRRSWDDGPPPKVRVQVLWQMDTLARPRGDVGVLFLPSGEFESHVVWPVDNGDGYDEITALRTMGEKFMYAVQHRIEPPVDGSDACLSAVKRRYAGTLAGMTEVPESLWHDWLDTKDELRHWQDLAREREAALRAAMAGAEFATVGGEKVVRRALEPVREHVRKASVRDRLYVIGKKGGGDE